MDVLSPGRGNQHGWVDILIRALIPEAITRGLGTCLIGTRVLWHQAVTSTMDVARQAAREGAPEGTVVIAEEQTAGKGRQGRSWVTAPGNLVLTIILKPPLAELPALNMVASLAVVQATARTTGLVATIKWPNDVLIGGRKLCGMLVDSEVVGGQVSFSLVGIGLNVALDPARYPEIAGIATSLSQEAGRPVSRLSVLRALLQEADALYLRLRAGAHGRAPLQGEWRRHMAMLGQRVAILQEGATVYEGVAEDVADDGSLLLRLPDGRLVPVLAGQVSLRPAL